MNSAPSISLLLGVEDSVNGTVPTSGATALGGVPETAGLIVVGGMLGKRLPGPLTHPAPVKIAKIKGRRRKFISRFPFATNAYAQQHRTAVKIYRKSRMGSLGRLFGL
jgi:hypothetical protein